LLRKEQKTLGDFFGRTLYMWPRYINVIDTQKVDLLNLLGVGHFTIWTLTTLRHFAVAFARWQHYIRQC